jgi:hypothetical protein
MVCMRGAVWRSSIWVVVSLVPKLAFCREETHVNIKERTRSILVRLITKMPLPRPLAVVEDDMLASSQAGMRLDGTSRGDDFVEGAKS